MKQRLGKIFSILNIVVAAIFIVLLLLISFGLFSAADFDNKVVAALLCVLAVLYLGTAAINFMGQFNTNQTIRQVLISTQQSGNVKVTKAVIKKLVSENVRTEEGVTLRGIKILATDHGLGLLIVLKVDGRNVRQTTDYLKNLLQDVFKNLLHMQFSSIDFKIVSLKSDYVPNYAVIKEESAAQTALAEEEEAKAETGEGKVLTQPKEDDESDQTAAAPETEEDDNLPPPPEPLE